MTRSLIALTLLAGCAGCDPRTPASGGVLDQASVHVFTSGADGFHTNTWFVDTGTEVIVVDAQFTPDVAEQALAYLRTVTQAPVTYVVATHPNPDKFGGAAVFQAEGATFVTSRATAASMPDVHAYKQAYFEGLGAFEPGTYPDMPQVDQTFDGSLTLDITGDGSVELFELSNGGVTTNQTVVRVNGQDLIVGDLVAVDTHAWLEGGIVDGAPAPNLMAWKRALAELSGRSWIWEETTPVAQIAEWFDDNGFQGLAEAIEDYGKTVSYPVGEFLLLLKKDLRTCETVHDDEPDPEVYAEARRQIELLRTTLTSTPAVMERARRLIRYATAMADSPKCRGPERDEALEAVRRAADAYEDARARIVRGQSWDALKTLRRIGERVALAAAELPVAPTALLDAFARYLPVTWAAYRARPVEAQWLLRPRHGGVFYATARRFAGGRGRLGGGRGHPRGRGRQLGADAQLLGAFPATGRRAHLPELQQLSSAIPRDDRVGRLVLSDLPGAGVG